MLKLFKLFKPKPNPMDPVVISFGYKLPTKVNALSDCLRSSSMTARELPNISQFRYLLLHSKGLVKKRTSLFGKFDELNEESPYGMHVLLHRQTDLNAFDIIFRDGKRTRHAEMIGIGFDAGGISTIQKELRTVLGDKYVQ